jgi:putative oxidoreductase
VARRPGQRRAGAVAAALTLTRWIVGGIFFGVGITHFGNHEVEVEDFRRWQLPLPDVAPYAVGAFEVVAGALLLLGVRPRLAAALLACESVGIIATAGRIDGGEQVVLPPILLVCCLVLAALGGGALQLSRRRRPAA